MAEGALPRDIWDQGFEEGERRMKRGLAGQASTALLGGFDVMLGLALVFSLTGALLSITTEEVSHAIGALPFGVAFVFITIGRSELFTENFLVPVGAFFAGRGTMRDLGRMWAVTLVFNLVGIVILAALLSIDGVLPGGALEAAGMLGDKFVDRGFVEALASAVVAGVAITLYTWLILASKSETARIVIALVDRLRPVAAGAQPRDRQLRRGDARGLRRRHRYDRLGRHLAHGSRDPRQHDRRRRLRDDDPARAGLRRAARCRARAGPEPARANLAALDMVEARRPRTPPGERREDERRQ